MNFVLSIVISTVLVLAASEGSSATSPPPALSPAALEKSVLPTLQHPPGQSGPEIMPPPELPVGPSSIFAVSGPHCPPGSDPYKGPEAQAAAKAGMLYCEMKRKVMVISKKSGVTGCPLPFVPYTSEAGITPAADVIWCRMMQPGETPPPAPDLPPLAAPLPNRDAPTMPKQITPNK